MSGPEDRAMFYHYDGSHSFHFEGKWRSGKTLALMLRRRYTPEATFRDARTGRLVTMVVGSWGMTMADWKGRRVHTGHALHYGPLPKVTS